MLKLVQVGVVEEGKRKGRKEKTNVNVLLQCHPQFQPPTKTAERAFTDHGPVSLKSR